MLVQEPKHPMCNDVAKSIQDNISQTSNFYSLERARQHSNRMWSVQTSSKVGQHSGTKEVMKVFGDKLTKSNSI